MDGRISRKKFLASTTKTPPQGHVVRDRSVHGLTPNPAILS